MNKDSSSSSADNETLRLDLISIVRAKLDAVLESPNLTAESKRLLVLDLLKLTVEEGAE